MESVTYVTPSYVPHRVTKPLSSITDKLSLILCALRKAENIAVFLSLILYRCSPDPLLCHAGNWRYPHILLGAGNWSATEERCHWCMETSVTLPRRYWHQQCCRVFQCRSVLQYHHRLVSLLFRPGMKIEIITVVNMKITVLWDVTTCSLINIYWRFGGMCFLHLPSWKVAIFIHKISYGQSLNKWNIVDMKVRGAENILICFNMKFSYIMFTIQFLPQRNTLHLH